MQKQFNSNIVAYSKFIKMKKRILLSLSCVALFAGEKANAQLYFASLLPQYSSRPLDINNSGTVVGTIDSSIHFLWLKGSEIEQIGQLTNGIQSLSTKIGEDNTKVIGLMFNPDTQKAEFSIYSTNSQSWTHMGGLGGTLDYGSSTPYAVTSDNTTVVGLSYAPTTNAPRAFKWTQETGFVNMGSLYADAYTRADAISDDKHVIGGYQDQEGGQRSGAFWVDGVENIILDESNKWVGLVRAISYDGSKMVGNPISGKFPYYYDRIANKVTYIKNTKFLQDMQYKGSVNGISNDGNTIIGYFGNTFSGQNESFVWTLQNGYKDFTDYVISLGVDVKGEYLYATAISPDGKKITGYTKTNKTYMLDLTTYLATDNTNKTEIKIYPNPASHTLNISGLKNETKLSIYNITGQLVKTSTSSEIDINNLPKGNYVISYDVDGKATSQKFIKQ